MAVIVSDSFNRANSTTTMGSTDSYNGGTAKTWTPRTGSVWGIYNNQAYAVSGANPFYTTVDAGVSDFSISVTIAAYSDEFVMFFRVNPANNTGLCFSATGRKLQSFSGSTYTTIAATSGNLAGTTTIKITASGSSITVYENGTQIITATSTINQTSTLHGLGNWRASGSTAGNTSWDSFQIEDLGTGGTSLTVSLSDSFTLSESFSRSLGVMVVDTINTSDAESEHTSKTLSDAFTVSDSPVTSTRGKSISLSDAITLTDAISKSISQLRVDTISTSDTEYDSSTHTLLDVVTLSDSVVISGGKAIMLTDSITLSDSIRKSVILSKLDALGLTDVIIGRQSSIKAYDIIVTTDVINTSLPNAPTIIGTIQLSGSQTLYVYLTGSRVIDVNLGGGV